MTVTEYALNEEQQGLQDSLRKFFKDEVGSEYLHKRSASDQAGDPVLWDKLQELGLLSYFAAEDEERAGFRELAVIATECGRALLPENIVANILYGPFLFYSLLGTDDRQAVAGQLPGDFLTGLAEGAVTVCYGGTSPSDVNTVAVQPGPKESLISGKMRFVSGAGPGSYMVCIICSEGSAKPTVLITAEELHGSEHVTVSSDPVLDLTLKRFAVECRDLPCLSLTGVESTKLEHLGQVVKAAEIQGVCERVVEMTQEQVTTRKQFGVPVGGFQAVQHKLVDMHLQTEALRSLTHFAAWSAEQSPDQLSLAARAALAYGVSVGPRIVETAIQLHGGTGFTWEYDLHLFLRRVRTLSALYGFKEKEMAEFLECAATV